MKELNCIECSVTLGEIEKGKFKKDMIFICKSCFEKYKIANEISKMASGSNKSTDMPDFFKDIFK